MGSCNTSTNCNPCGPDFNAINQLATRAGAYARQANTYAVDAENSWLEFNALYLGAFAVAPAVDNEGNPLQTGALYWNSALNNLWVWDGTMWMPAVEGELYLGGFAVAPTLDNEGNPLQAGNLYWNTASNNLWAYDGTSWLRTNFNETTPFFTQFTTSGAARSLEVRMRQDISSVKDWGAVGDGVADDTNAINLAIQFSQNYIFFPPGTYRVTSPIIIEKTIRLIGAGSHSSFISINHSGNGIVFQPVGAGTSNVFLNSCSIVDLNVSRPSSITTPADNIWLRQCNGFRAVNVSSNNGNTCFRISGGQLNSLDGCRAFASNTSIVKATQNAGILLEDAELSGGSFQDCFTVNISNLFGSTTNILDYNIKVRSCDGLNISNAYLAFADRAHIGFVRQRTASNVTAINITNVYCDCMGFFGGLNTPQAIFVTHSLPAGTYGVNGLNVSDCVFANNAGDPSVGNFNALIYFLKFGQSVSIKGSYIANSGSAYGVQIHDASVGGPSGSYVFSGNTFSNLSNDPAPGGGGALYAKDINQLIISDNNFRNTATSAFQVLVDGDNGSLSAIGNITDGSATQMVSLGTSTFTGNVVLLNAGQTTTNIVRLALPTSSVGLPSGAMWNNAGNVEIVP
jgi:hypothetical protein